MYYLIGSRAMQVNGFNGRKCKDWDIVDTEATEHKPSDILGPNRNVEIHPGNSLYNQGICENYSDDCIIVNNIRLKVVNTRGLCIIKRSHLHRPLDFQKHIRDYHNLKKICVRFTKLDLGFLKERTKLTKEEFGDKTPKLNMSNDDFFDDPVKKYYIHDEIHEAVAYYDRPLYERLKTDQSQAMCAKDLWNNLTHKDKIKCVQEECFVIGLERFIIPNWIEQKKNYPPKFAFNKALEKVCTTLCSGWFRDFAIDNWPEINKYEVDFVKKFKQANLRKV